MPWVVPVVAGAAALGSAAIGAAQAGSAESDAQNAAIAAAQQYLQLTVPDPAEQQLILQQYQQTGQMDPRLATAFQQSQTNLSKISTDPALASAQQNALSSLENEASNGGHTLSQDAYVQQLAQETNAENAGRQGAIEQQFGERGMGAPSGLMLSAEEQNNQNETNQESQGSMQAAAQAQQNALQSLQESGQQAGQMRQQDFGQAAAVAQAQDSISQFNTQMNQGVENSNIAAQNQAQAYNVQEAQQIANQNVGLENQQQVANKGLAQQQYEDQLQKAGGAAAGYEGEAGQYNNTANTQANMWGNISQGIAKTGGSVAQSLNGNNNNGGGTTNNYYSGSGSNSGANTNGYAGTDEDEFGNIS